MDACSGCLVSPQGVLENCFMMYTPDRIIGFVQNCQHIRYCAYYTLTQNPYPGYGPGLIEFSVIFVILLVHDTVVFPTVPEAEGMGLALSDGIKAFLAPTGRLCSALLPLCLCWEFFFSLSPCPNMKLSYSFCWPLVQGPEEKGSRESECRVQF